MRIARPILAFLIALSVAVLPAAGHVGASMKPVDMADMTDMSAMDDMACCPNKSHPAKKAIDDCASMAGCILCFGFLGPVATNVASPSFAKNIVIALANHPLDSQPTNPPFRPPRV
jgi:hypothetical protein